MNRSLLIAALATLAAGTVAAQSSVTVYGRLNTSVERQKNITSTENVWVLQNNGSRIGFKGVEDLGGGLKAGFHLEHRFNVDTGAATNAAFWGGAGISEVYLGGNFGTVRLGHFSSEAYFATSDAIDLVNHATGTSADALYKYLGNDNNKIAYRTPALGPLTAEAAVSLAEGPVPTNKVYDLAANYAAGPLGIGFGYEKVYKGDSQFAVRGSFGTGPFLVAGYVQRYKNLALNDNQTIYRISGMYTMGPGEFHLAFGSQGDLGAADVSAKQFTIGYNHNLSKRTKVFAFYNKVDNDSNALRDPSSVALGVRHNF